jgi:hypothetical protein
MTKSVKRAFLVTESGDWYQLVQSVLVGCDGDAEPLLDGLLGHLLTTEQAKTLLADRREQLDLLLLDAHAREMRNSGPDTEGCAAEAFLRWLAKERPLLPVVVLLKHPLEMLELAVSRALTHTTLEVAALTAEALRDAWERASGQSQAHRSNAAPGVAIELEIKSGVGRFWVSRGSREAERPRNKPLRNPHRLHDLAGLYRNWQIFEECAVPGRDRTMPVANWRSQMSMYGRMVYDELVRDCLSEKLLQKLYKDCGDEFAQVHFRLHTADAELFDAPFEAMFDDKTQRFLKVYHSFARRFCRDTVAPANEPRRDGSLKLLFLSSQVQGQLALQDSQGKVVERPSFRPLENLEAERADLQNIAAASQGRVLVHAHDLAAAEGRSAAQSLRDVLRRERWDFVHFAGHSYTTRDRSTYLVLPAGRAGRAIGLPVKSFARQAAAAGASFVYLSSCRGSSSETVRHMVENGVPDVLGFRWDVDDQDAVEFAHVFYKALLVEHCTFGRAYLNASRSLHDDVLNGRESTIWAAPLLVMQSDDWWQRKAA